jgi:arylsulfatase A-like enzyme
MEDLLPTLVKAAGVKVPVGIDGGDISAVLAGGKRVTPDFIWYYPHVWGATGPGIEPFAAIREGDLKAILFFYDERVELYDITKDSSESKDLATERPQEASRLKLKLLAALKTAGRKLPTR